MMVVLRNPPLTGVLLACTIVLAGRSAPLQAQWPGVVPSSQFELSEAVQLDQIDNALRAQLDRVAALLADRQWDEGVELLRQLAETSEGKLIDVAPHRFIPLREWCQLRLAALPPEALKLYRARVDPVAQKWYEQGIAARDRRLLQNVVDQAFASSFGDDALMALGEMSFESGDFAAARWQWQRIVPVTPPTKPDAAAQPAHRSDLPLNGWPSYPDTNLDLATVRARLVLASILEGAADRAKAELAAFAKLHPDAQGTLGGRHGRYVALLESFLAESLSWPAMRSDAGWPTFAGNPQRNKTAAALVDLGAVAWRTRLRQPLGDDGPMGSKTIGENVREPLSFYPVVSGDRVFIGNDQQVLALLRDTGKPAWGRSRAIFQSELPSAALPRLHSAAVGSPRFTMTVFRDRLLARVGSTVTGEPQGSTPLGQPGSLVCLDLAAEGRLLWKITPESGWAFEGAPLADDRGVYVAMRRQDIRPQTFVACLSPDTGRLCWRRFVCGAETPARGILPEQTHNLLTLCGGTLYYSTNLGAVAALRTDDGRVQWISLYPRALRGDLAKLAPHWRRDPSPCLLDRGTLLVAPADSPRILAFDAATGQLLWQTGPEVEDATALLGVTSDWLIAGGSRLYWISLKDEDHGRVKHVWPESAERPGHGRGILAGQNVLWPARDKLYIFDAQTAQPRRVVDLAALGAAGGNLLVANGRLLIATETELIALQSSAGRPVIGKNSPNAN
jgi:outer membrane protein assembly factor BamB